MALDPPDRASAPTIEGMEPWVWWLVAVGVLSIAEILTGVGLVFGMLAVGAGAGAVSAAAGAPAGLSMIIASLVSVAMLLGVRPIARKHLQQPRSVRTGIAALVGSDALVIEQVNGVDGRVKLAGEIWSARSYDGQAVHDAGTIVSVLGIEGATALIG